jgi:hypothetical protein
VENVANSEEIFVRNGLVTDIVFSVSLIVPTTPFREYAVIAFSDDNGADESLVPHPLRNIKAHIRIISDDTNTPLAFMVSLPKFLLQNNMDFKKGGNYSLF